MAKAPFWETEDFKRLNAEWREKLAESGFRDIEVLDERGEPNGVLQGVSVGDLNRNLYKPEVQRYYELARQHVRRVTKRLKVYRLRGTATPEHELGYDAWTMHANGMDAQAIGSRLGISAKVTRRLLGEERARMYAAVRRADQEELEWLANELGLEIPEESRG